METEIKGQVREYCFQIGKFAVTATTVVVVFEWV